MIKESTEVKPEHGSMKKNAYPCIFMNPPEPDTNQAAVVYSNNINSNGVWSQYHTAKTKKMNNTDTVGSAFKSSGTSSPSMVKFSDA